MWLLLFIVFSGPMKVERVDVIEIHWNEKECVTSTREAEKIGIPTNVSVGCIRVEGMAEAKDGKGLASQD